MTCIQPNLGSCEKLSGPDLCRSRAYPLPVLPDMFHDDDGSTLRLVKLRKQAGGLARITPTMILCETRSL